MDRFSRRRQRPEVTPLEPRRLLTVDPGKIVVKATPKILAPPDGEYLRVTVSGSMVISDPKFATGFFNVTDQYGQIEPFGPVTLTISPTDPHSVTYSFPITLRAKIGSMTTNGRQYDILVGAKDAAGAAGKTIAVNVLKDPPQPNPHPHGPHTHSRK
jgi:hypothetical protein